MIRSWIERVLARVVPPGWRETVVTDLRDEAQTNRRSSAWFAWHVLRASMRLRLANITDSVFSDFRYAIRSLLRAPAFTAGAVLTLVLGIGVNLAVFAVVDRVLFRPLPFGDAERLAFVWPFSPETGQNYGSFNKKLFIEGRTSLPAIEDMASLGHTEVLLLGETRDVSQTLALTVVSYNLLDVLGVRSVAGRAFTRDDALAKRRVGMVTYEAWQARFGGSESLLGRRIGSNDGVEIVGVLPKGFIAPAMGRGVRFDGVVMMPDLLETVQKPNETVFPGVARLAPGVSMPVAQEQYDSLAARLDDELRLPGEPRGPRVRLEPLRSGMFWYSYRYLWLLTAAAGLVGLLACANLSSLLLARGRSREQQVALRSALGASRGRLLAGELAQSLTVCAIAGAVAMSVVSWVTDGLRALAHPSFAALVLDGIDHRLVAATAAAVLASCVIASLWPAWSATRNGLIGVLQRTTGVADHVRSNRAGQLVLAIEAALGVVLVFGAAVTARSFAGLVMTDLGMDTDRLHVVRIVPTGNRRGGDDVAERARYLDVLEALRRQPGIVAAGGVDSMPAQGITPSSGRDWAPGIRAGLWQITDGFLSALGARIVAGRDVTPDEVQGTHPVALITETMARRLWPDDPPAGAIGRQLVPVTNNPSDSPRQARQIIGVVGDIRNRPDSAPEPMVFAPIAVPEFFQLQFAVRTSTPVTPDEDQLRRQLARFGVTGVNIDPAGDRIASSLREPRARAILFGSFGIVGLVLASIGLFAVASFHVAQRRYEIGVRSALGASARSVRRMVIADAVRPVVVGALAGVVAAYWAAEFLQSLVHQIDARDPWTLGMVVMTLISTAVLASWPPARRAARIDPAVVLREG